jgi:hypothetical protein
MSIAATLIGRAVLLLADQRGDQLPDVEPCVGAGEEGTDSAQLAARDANVAISTAPTIRTVRPLLLFTVIDCAFLRS